jgi:hypothetical protein
MSRIRIPRPRRISKWLLALRRCHSTGSTLLDLGSCRPDALARSHSTLHIISQLSFSSISSYCDHP